MGEQRLLRKGTDSGETAAGSSEPQIFRFPLNVLAVAVLCDFGETGFFKNKGLVLLDSKFLPSSVTISTEYFQVTSVHPMFGVVITPATIYEVLTTYSILDTYYPI